MKSNSKAKRSDRSIGTDFQEYLRRDNRRTPDTLAPSPPVVDPSYDRIDVARYTSREFHEVEKSKLWPRVWQMACREEHIPHPGDFTVYDIADKSFVIVRQLDGSIKAFYNSCLHRGRPLVTAPGSTKQLRCPFHGFTWKLDGQLQDIPCRWDFPHVKDEDCALPEAHVDTWGRWVFINMSPQPIPLREYLGPLPSHFAEWGLERSYLGAHVARVVKCNWKATLEAFSEAWHSHDTHPQILAYTGDTNSQYDCWPEHPYVDRMITPFAVPSPYLEGRITEQEIADVMLNMPAGRERKPMYVPVPPGTTGRTILGEMMRGVCSSTWWTDMSHASDCELLDAILYNVFPNFVPWGGYGTTINYRYRPNGDDHETSIMEVMLLMRYPKGKVRPPTAKVHWLEPDEPWANAHELGPLGPVFDQDMSNLTHLQRGLHSSVGGKLLLSRYQESRLRHFHQLLDRFLAVD